MNNKNYDYLFVLCKMFIKESNTFKILLSNLYEEFNVMSESLYYMNQHQNEILNLLLNNFDLDSFDSTPSFYHFIRYKKSNPE